MINLKLSLRKRETFLDTSFQALPRHEWQSDKLTDVPEIKQIPPKLSAEDDKCLHRGLSLEVSFILASLGGKPK